MITLSGTPVLTTERLILRAPQAGDWPQWWAFARTDRARFIGGPMTEWVAWRALCHMTGHWVHRGFGTFVFALRDRPEMPLGSVGPWFPAGWPEREIGWTVWSPDAEGRGLAFEAATAARSHAYATLGWPGAVSYIDEGNDRSVALALRLGATLDPDAAAPDFPGDDTPVRVYRHPAPGSA
jgi:RimJ/RimL family protein N-acetyltransferase